MIDNHTTISFFMFTIGLILFVVSLQEDYYSYQVKRLGQSFASILIIVAAFHGYLTGLWKCRIWFCFPLATVALRNGIEYLVEKYCPYRTPIYDLKPQATW